MSEKIPGAHTTGYGKPPKEHQFRKGQSGNPKGRPKKKTPLAANRSIPALLLEQAQNDVTVGVNGAPATMSGEEALLKSLMARAIQGHGPSLRIVMPMLIEERKKKASSLVLTPREDWRKYSAEEKAAAYKRMMDAADVSDWS